MGNIPEYTLSNLSNAFYILLKYKRHSGNGIKVLERDHYYCIPFIILFKLQMTTSVPSGAEIIT